MRSLYLPAVDNGRREDFPLDRPGSAARSLPQPSASAKSATTASRRPRSTDKSRTVQTDGDRGARNQAILPAAREFAAQVLRQISTFRDSVHACAIRFQPLRLMKRVEPQDFVAGFLCVPHVNASRERITPKHVAPVPHRFHHHKGKSIVPHGAPDNGSPPVKFNQVWNPSMDLQVRRGVRDFSFVQTNQLERNVRQPTGDTQYEIKSIKSPRLTIGT